MALHKFTRRQRLIAAIAISFSFFIVELVVGFLTRSFALIADAFHYVWTAVDIKESANRTQFGDLVGVVVALGALVISEKSEAAPPEYTFGWQRATVLGAFFNGVFLFAVGISILVQAVERCIHLDYMDKPEIVLIVGCVGLALNILVMSFLHEHGDNQVHDNDNVFNARSKSSCDSHDHQDAMNANNCTSAGIRVPHRALITSNHNEHKHTLVMLKSPGRDLGMLGVLIHVMGDAINNIGVIIAAIIIWKTKGEARYYADPAVGIFISIMILLSSLPLVRNSGSILLQIAPGGIKLDDVKHDIEMIPGIRSVHELHIWRLNQQKSIASAHLVVEDDTIENFTEKAKIIMECLHAYGIHSATLQPEVSPADSTEIFVSAIDGRLNLPSHRLDAREQCQLVCGSMCDGMRCCKHIPAE